MSQFPDDPGKHDLDERLAQARARQAGSPGMSSGGGPDPGIGIAMRSGVEFVATIVVSTGIGVLLDRWLHTTPVVLLVMLALGFGAGLLNIYRTLSAQPMPATTGKSRKADDDNEDDDG